MRDDMDFNIHFCEEMEKFPILYDYSLAEYSNRSVQNLTWFKISEKFDASAPECREQWKNIRGSYSKYKAKLKTKSGQSRKGVKQYYLTPHLHFLGPFMKSRTSKGNIDEDIEDDSTVDGMTEVSDKDGDYDSVASELPATSESVATSSRAPSLCSSVNEDQNFLKPPCSISSNESDYRKRKKTSGVTAFPMINNVNRKAFQYFEKKEQIIDMKNSLKNITPEPRDPDIAFLQSVLPDMKAMNDSQKRHYNIWPTKFFPRYIIAIDVMVRILEVILNKFLAMKSIYKKNST